MWNQWREARQLTRRLRILLDKQKDLSKTESLGALGEDVELGTTEPREKLYVKYGEWTSVHSFFVLMGGLAVDTADLTGKLSQ